MSKKNDRAEKSIKLKYAQILIFSLIILGLAYFVFTKKLFFNSLQNEVASKEFIIKNLDKTIYKSEGLSEHLSAIQVSLNELKKRVLNFHKETHIYRFFLNKEQESGVKFVKDPELLRAYNLFKCEKIDLEDDLSTYSGDLISAKYAILVEGNYANVIKFFYEITHNDPIVFVENFEIKKNNNTKASKSKKDTKFDDYVRSKFVLNMLGKINVNES